MVKKQQHKSGGFMGWYESYSGKRVTGIIYSVGASVVIIGALFKILHWPGASQVLMLGMFTEAFLFLIGTLDKPHTEFHWQEVFPQLLGKGTNPEVLQQLSTRPRPTLLGAGVAGGSNGFAGGEPLQKNGFAGGEPLQGHAPIAGGTQILDAQSAAQMKNSINTFAVAAQQFGELGKVAAQNVQLGNTLSAAGEATNKYIASQESLASVTQTLGQQLVNTVKVLHSSTDTFAKSYSDMGTQLAGAVNSVQEYGRNISSVGEAAKRVATIYESEISILETQAQAMVSSAKTANALQQSSSAALANMETYQKSTRALVENVERLNGVYGNMLNALS